MPLSPEGRAILNRADELGLLGAELDTVDELRDAHQRQRDLMGEAASVARVEQGRVRGPDGSIPVRIYAPPGEPPFPVIVFYHGGGWVLGTLDDADIDCRELCLEIGAVVVSVAYRLAPEHRFPAGLLDAYAGFRWSIEYAGRFGGAPSVVAVGGDSAGGNLAAAIAVVAADRAERRPDLALLIYPPTDCARTTESYSKFARGYFLEEEDMRWFWDQYTEGAHCADPRASILRSDASTQPPTVILTAEYDVLRDEGESWGRRLAEAGVPVHLARCDGAVHGFWSYGRVAPRARAWAMAEIRNGMLELGFLRP